MARSLSTGGLRQQIRGRQELLETDAKQHRFNHGTKQACEEGALDAPGREERDIGRE